MRQFLLLVMVIPLWISGCSRPIAAEAVDIDAPPSAATGPRWVVIKADGLSCATCAADLKADLDNEPDLSQIEVFAPAPYCRFHVETGELDVPRLLDEFKAKHSAALEGYSFVRGG